MSRPQVVITILSIISSILLLILIFVKAEIDALNYEFSDIQQEIQETRRDNAILREKILMHSSLSNIKNQALEQGFTQATSNDYVHFQ